MTRRRRCSASSMSSNGSVVAQLRDLQRAREVAVALVARLQQVEQLGGELVAALPVHRAERVGVGQPAGRRVEHERLGQALVGEEVAALAGDDPDRQAGAAADLLQHDRDQHAGGRGRARARGRSAAPPGRRRGGRTAPCSSRPRRAPRSCAAGSVSSSARIAAESAVSSRSTRSASRSPSSQASESASSAGGGQVTDACSRNGRAVTGLRTAVSLSLLLTSRPPRAFVLSPRAPRRERLLGDPNKFRRTDRITLQCLRRTARESGDGRRCVGRGQSKATPQPS